MPAPVTLSGTCHASFAFEVGQDIDLEACERLLGPAERQRVRSRRRVPRYFDYRPAPLRLPQEAPALLVGGLPIARVDVVLYDFGAAAVNYALPYEGGLDRLVPISVELQEAATLIDDARARLLLLVEAVRPAITRPHVTTMVEDYIVFQVDRFAEGFSLQDLWRGPARELAAQVLRGVDQPLSSEERRDALRLRLSFSAGDVTIVDWNAALLYDPEPEETRFLLEFANVQLLELRHLDEELDRVLDQAYESLTHGERGWRRALRAPVAPLRRLGELQVDSAVLFERVSNAVKLVGDRFLGRVYLAASERFHFADWDQAIGRKLGVLDGIYQKVSDRVTARRLEVLEWIIILLITLSVIFSFVQY